MSPAEREEYRALWSEALNGDRTVTHEKVLHFHKLLLDAVQAQRPWATIVLNSAVIEGLRKELKGRSKAEVVALVDYNGESVGKSLRLGRRRTDADGRSYFQQALIHEFSWDELAEWLNMVERQITSLLVNRHMADRLLSLRIKHPFTYGPAEACQLEGTTIETFLGQVEAA